MNGTMRALVVRDTASGRDVFVRIIWDPLTGDIPEEASTHDAVAKYIHEYCGEYCDFTGGIYDQPGSVPEDFEGKVCNIEPAYGNRERKSYDLYIMRFDVAKEASYADQYRREAARYEALEKDDPPDYSSARNPIIVKGSYTDDFFDVFWSAMAATFLSLILVWIGHLLFNNNNDEEV